MIQTTQTDRPISLQLSAITFAETPREEFLFTSTAPLSDYSALQYMGQNPANVNRGLMLARERGFTGARPGVPRVVLLLTQGIKAEFNHYVEEAENNAYNEANLLRSEGVRLLAVGASQSPEDSIEAFLSNISEDNYWLTADSQTVTGINNYLHQMLIGESALYYL